MKREFSKRFMEIPVRMYKAEDLDSHYDRKEKLGIDSDDEEIEYVIGYARISPYDIMEWYDCFSRPRTIDDVKEEGFDSTRIKTKTGEMYDCVWSRNKFESRLDKFVAEFEEELGAELQSDGETIII